MAFKKVGLILGTEGPFRNIIQITFDQPFNLLDLKKLHQLYPQDWIIIYTHPFGETLEFDNQNNNFYKTIEEELAPFHLFFVIYEPKLGDFIFKYENSLFTGKYDAFGIYLKNVILPSSEFQEILCEGLKTCFHLNFLLNYKWKL